MGVGFEAVKSLGRNKGASTKLNAKTSIDELQTQKSVIHMHLLPSIFYELMILKHKFGGQALVS